MQSFLTRMAEKVFPSEPVYAHCDIPCGIYDPHEAQIAALTVLRMVQLANDSSPPDSGATAEQKREYHLKLARFAATKEAHAEIVKHQVRVIWGDYFTPDMLKEFPQVNDLVARILREASKARQGFSLESANTLVGSVQSFAEVFWKSKKVETRRIPSHQKSGGDLVVPSL